MLCSFSLAPLCSAPPRSGTAQSWVRPPSPPSPLFFSSSSQYPRPSPLSFSSSSQDLPEEPRPHSQRLACSLLPLQQLASLVSPPPLLPFLRPLLLFVSGARDASLLLLLLQRLRVAFASFQPLLPLSDDASSSSEGSFRPRLSSASG